MPSRSKKTPTIVVRPMERGTRTARKIVFATLKELNPHAPLAEIAPHLILEDPKPWKKESRSHPTDKHKSWRTTRRNTGRDDGQTYRSSRYVCGRAVEPEPTSEKYGSYEMDVGDEWEGQWAGHERGDEEDRRHQRVEVCIMDIAKPAKPRGAAKEYDVIETVRRVIALGDEDEWEQWTGLNNGVEYEDWEAIEDESSLRLNTASYAMVAQRAPG